VIVRQAARTRAVGGAEGRVYSVNGGARRVRPMRGWVDAPPPPAPRSPQINPLTWRGRRTPTAHRLPACDACGVMRSVHTHHHTAQPAPRHHTMSPPQRDASCVNGGAAVGCPVRTRQPRPGGTH
jgi:hypothetical protein